MMDDLAEFLQEALGYGNIMEATARRHRDHLDWRSKNDRQGHLFERNGRPAGKRGPAPWVTPEEKRARKAARQRRYRETARGGAPKRSWTLSQAQRDWARTVELPAAVVAYQLGTTIQAIAWLRSHRHRAHDEHLVNGARQRRGETHVA